MFLLSNEGTKVKETSKAELVNTISHGIGVVLFIFLTYLMVEKASTTREMLAYLVYGLSNILLFGSSAIYHAFSHSIASKWLQIIDHVAIYLLIAGTYTPFLAISLGGTTVGDGFLGVIWLTALVGIVFEIFIPNRFPRLRTILYLIMGWSIIFIFPEIVESVDNNALYWVLAGGIAYTIGVFFYNQKTKPWFHVIWHFFVLFAAIFMFVGIYFYI